MGSKVLINGYHGGQIPPEVLTLQNDNSKNWIVQKFGGTSVGKFADKIAEDIVRYARCLMTLSRHWYLICDAPGQASSIIALL